MATRRRFLTIAATCAALGPLASARALASGRPAADLPEPVTWRGVALGALASMTLVHPDREHARALLARSLDELARLEAIFSLYRPDSALARLNRSGELAAPATELVELLSFGLELARRTDGAFDPTVQPLFALYIDHFRQPDADPAGPSREAIARSLAAVGHRHVELDAGRIRLRQAGAAVTLNGIAQGYITDRIAATLRAGGLDDILLDLGEGRASGRRPDGTPWRVAVADPADPSRTLVDVPLGSEAGMHPALATSGGYGTRFGTDPRIHHLLDPRTGHSANHHASVSVAAPNATLADGLATALAILPPARARAVLANYPTVDAWFIDGAGRVTRDPGA